MRNCLKIISFGFLLSGWLIFPVSGQQPVKRSNVYGLNIVSSIAEYHDLVSENPEKALIDLETYLPGVVLDIRYATTNNFTGQQIYTLPKAFVRKPVAEALLKIQEELSAKGLGLKIFDAYRPYDATVKFFEVYADTNFVASPRTGSRHNRACSIDVSLIDLKTKKELAMPTDFDDFTDKAAHSYLNLPETAIKNRHLLQRIMTKHGFLSLNSEWWHYDYTDWRNFELMNISFQELVKNK
jgi:D-alanyl-D-alanine dipeptidase